MSDDPKSSDAAATTYSVAFEPNALVELDAIAARVEADYDADTARDYVLRLREQVLALERFPRRGQVRGRSHRGEIRSIASRDRRYYLYFEIDDATHLVRLHHIESGGSNREVDPSKFGSG